jgi:hypothetical protein
VKVTTKLAAAKLHDPDVTPSLVRMWVHKGWLRPTGTLRGTGGRPASVFDMTDVWRAYTRWLTKENP